MLFLPKRGTFWVSYTVGIPWVLHVEEELGEQPQGRHDFRAEQVLLHVEDVVLQVHCLVGLRLQPLQQPLRHLQPLLVANSQRRKYALMS